MKLEITSLGVKASYEVGAESEILFSDIATIGIEVIGGMPVDLDLVSLNHENGDYLEFTDDAEGFSDILEHLSRKFSIVPPISERFCNVLTDGDPIYVYTRSSKKVTEQVEASDR